MTFAMPISAITTELKPTQALFVSLAIAIFILFITLTVIRVILCLFCGKKYGWVNVIGEMRWPLFCIIFIGLVASVTVVPAIVSIRLNHREYKSVLPYARVGSALIEWQRANSTTESDAMMIRTFAHPTRSQLIMLRNVVPGFPRMSLHQVRRVLTQYVFLGKTNLNTLLGSKSTQLQMPLFITCVLPDTIIGSARYAVYRNKTFRVIRASDWQELRAACNKIRKKAGLGEIPPHPWQARQSSEK